MILTIKAKEYEQLSDGSLRITADGEEFVKVLAQHSPNILVNYLNDNYTVKIATIRKWKKGGDDGTI